LIRAVANKRLDLSDEEFSYYQSLEESFGKDEFSGLFSTDEAGLITFISPSPERPTAMVIIFFLLNVMMNQKLRSIDDGLSKLSDLERRIKYLEEQKRSE
jgi:hypothetical protein